MQELGRRNGGRGEKERRNWEKGRKRVTGAGEDGERENGRAVVDCVDWKIQIGWRIQASGSMPM